MPEEIAIKDAIYNEEENDDMMKVVAMFDSSSRSFQLRYGACFLHKILWGISPTEKLLE